MLALESIIESLLDKKTLDIHHLAKKHGVSVEHIQSQMKMGIGVEQEHTSDKRTAAEIARDHLGEDPHYYSKLKKMESK